MPDTEGPEKKEKREFMREKIVKQPLSRRQIARRIAALAGLAVLFGAVSAVSFTAVRPLAERYLDPQETGASDPIQFTQDEPETAASEAEPETDPAAGQVEEEQLEEAVSQALGDYRFTPENVYAIGNALREVGARADKGIVTVSSGRQQTDFFGNPVESTGDFAGAVIARTSGEFLIFTYADAVQSADTIYVTFSDGVRHEGTIRQIDEVLDMAVVSVKANVLPETVRDQTAVLTLGNSHAVRAGDLVLGIGGPAGFVHSLTSGTISYVERNVQMTDRTARILYADLSSNSRAGTFLLNMAGEVIGWTTEEYRAGESSERTAAIGISDYKTILERLTNGEEAPYFGIRGQEVEETWESGIPSGVYVTEAVAGSPAYDAGIQNGDIISRYGDTEIRTFRDLQTEIENSRCGAPVLVTVMRRGRDGYTELEYQVNIRAR